MTSTPITPGQPLSATQKLGLNLVAVGRGRDIVLAIDMTESVGLNDEGRIRLRQIVEDSLKPGDLVYVVPFAKDVDLRDVKLGVHPLGTPVNFSSGSKADIDKVLAKIPFNPDPNRYGTDIQRAELTIYQGLAQINQERLQQKQAIKPQSVVWLTDAPLFKKPGITSQVWIETPADSPFRIAQSPESQERQAWISALPLQVRSRSITTQDNKQYKLTVVDIAPTVQEFCTPAPNNKEVCLVNPYLRQQLWLPTLVLFIFVLAVLGTAWKVFRLRKTWDLIVDFEATATPEDKKCRLPNKKRIAIGEYDATCVDSIDCPGVEIRAYLERRGESLYLVPTNSAPIYYQGKEINSRTRISNSRFRLNCPDTRKGDYEIIIQVKK
ncbi:VWA domain-containing protein [Anabaena azotica]|uniref:VWA domain-containing protein n=1 Tax=Anabaena azotica FACHB-119 TaxID=947527 RepID=A0ABR8D9Z9_9NOST|nr:VWA domain-containing protein [Anabaena azotica]MBD2504017.1 VWA domain-containing protein [Anabaena azotica FACHB-119]